MFWKKKVEKPSSEFYFKYVAKSIQGTELEGWLRASSGKEFLNWIENLENALKVGIFDKSIPFTNEELLYRQGEVDALKKLGALIKELRTVKPETEQTEE